MLRPTPSAYTRFSAYTEMLPKLVASRSPRVVSAMLTIAPKRGSSPATTLRKMTSSSTSRIGMATVSASRRSCRLCALPWASRAWSAEHHVAGEQGIGVDCSPAARLWR